MIRQSAAVAGRKRWEAAAVAVDHDQLLAAAARGLGDGDARLHALLLVEAAEAPPVVGVE